MTISQPAREAAVRIAMKNISLTPSEEVIVAIAEDVQKELDKVTGKYYVMRDSFPKYWDGGDWEGEPEKRKVYTAMDEAIKAYRMANMTTSEAVYICHRNDKGVVRCKPL